MKTFTETDHFTIDVERKSDCGEVPADASGSRTIVYGYVSDEAGNIVDEGEHITLVMAVGVVSPVVFCAVLCPGRADRRAYGHLGGNVWIRSYV